MMLQYEVKAKDGDSIVTLTLYAADKDEYSPVFMDGSMSLEMRLAQALATKQGAFGHLFDPDNTTAVDLAHVLLQLKEQFEIKLIEGQQLIKDVGFDGPSNSVS